jgi:hypothetical protein
LTIRNIENVKVCKKIERILKANDKEKEKTRRGIEKLKEENRSEKVMLDDFIKSQQ